jgi:uncharacterized protein
MIAADPLLEKERCLRSSLRALESCIVAFSGGVDSALVLKVATDELGNGVLGVTAVSQSLPGEELDRACAFAASIGARHEIVRTNELSDRNYRANPANRCYFCKNEVYGLLAELAKARGVRSVVDGFNASDEADWRPGRKAAREHHVRSPLAEAGFEKHDVRALAQRLGLDVWDKPALACLSSRIPYGTAITPELLRQVDRAEQAVRAAGFRTCRVRHHGDVARIELPLGELARACEPEVRQRIVTGVRAAGYRYAELDLDGYVSGNLNRRLP